MQAKSIVNLVKLIFATLRYRIGDCVLINAWVLPSFWGIKKNNFGDDINKPLIEHITGKHVSFLCKVKSFDENLLAIGSIIDTLTTENSVIWGAGYLSETKTLCCIPKRVCAVRGPLTRDVLLSYGVDCPEIYGDPALLMPFVFKPKVNKKYKYGIIPHACDYNNPVIQSFRKNHPEYLYIKMEGYTSWKDVISQICSCERIISSSLHGLIISDAYKVPNVFVQFSDKVVGGEFKYKDYMYGVGREYHAPLNMKEIIDISAASFLFEKYKTIDYNPKPLLDAFPYRKIGIFSKF